MTDNSFPMVPPPELVEQWMAEVWHEGTPVRVAASDIHIATQAACWGADQELEACCEWLETYVQRWAEWSANFRADRRPKPPSLKEQALKELEILSDYAHGLGCDGSTIRQVLEALPND